MNPVSPLKISFDLSTSPRCFVTALCPYHVVPHHCCLFSELLPSYESPIVTHTNQTSESSQQSQATLNTNKPVPRKRILHVSQDSSVDRNGPSCKQGVTLVPRGILKNNSISSSCSSSNDSLPPQSPQRAEPLSPIDHLGSYSSGSASGSWLDRKHVRFSGIDRGRNPALQNGRELGEHGLLDHDSVAFSDDEEGQTDKSDTSISSSNGDDVSNEGLSSPREECDSPFFSKTLEKIEPELSISSSSSPQDSNLWACKVVNYEEVKTGELQNSTEGSLQKDSKEGEALWSTGKAPLDILPYRDGQSSIIKPVNNQSISLDSDPLKLQLDLHDCCSSLFINVNQPSQIPRSMVIFFCGLPFSLTSVCMLHGYMCISMHVSLLTCLSMVISDLGLQVTCYINLLLFSLWQQTFP